MYRVFFLSMRLCYRSVRDIFCVDNQLVAVFAYMFA